MVRVLMRPSFPSSFSLIFLSFKYEKKNFKEIFPFHSDDILDRLCLASLQLW